MSLWKNIVNSIGNIRREKSLHTICTDCLVSLSSNAVKHALSLSLVAFINNKIILRCNFHEVKIYPISDVSENNNAKKKKIKIKLHNKMMKKIFNLEKKNVSTGNTFIYILK